jgi:REP element-mobilizing transposase RayT
MNVSRAMAHSYVSSVFHVVFSTKERTQLIRAASQTTLWNYLAGIARNLRIQVLAIGGTENHVHILLVLPADQKLSDAVRTLKCNSSRWLRETHPRFAWQEGYGAFSVSPSQLERVKHYIANQAEHHRRRSFEEEFLAMLQAANVKFEREQVFG